MPTSHDEPACARRSGPGLGAHPGPATTRSWRLGETPWAGRAHGRSLPRCRVVIDNDFAGDPDGLVQLAHHALSPSVDIRVVIGSHAPPADIERLGTDTAADACARVRELFATMGLNAGDRVVPGADAPLAGRTAPRVSVGARAIVAEAMRPDDLPLYVVCGGGLTDLASAYLLEPAIADRLTAVWIGGPEYASPPTSPPPVTDPEYNLGIDVAAAQVVVTDSAIPLWQVPRDAYMRCVVSDSELQARLLPHGPLGAHLYRQIEQVHQDRAGHGLPLAETYVLGDSPLVLLTALQGYWVPDPSSSEFSVRRSPVVDDAGRVGPGSDGRLIRVYDRLDTRLMLEDLYAKLELFARWQSG